VRDQAYDMVRVNTADPNPYYLRFGVAEELTNNGFVNRPLSAGVPLSSMQPQPQINGPGITYRQNQAQVEILNFNEQVLPVYQNLQKMERLDNGWQWDRRANVVYSNRNTAKGRKYTVTYVRPEYTPEALRTAADLRTEDPVRSLYTRLPDVQAVKKTAQDLIKGKTTQYDKVRAIYDFFSPTNGFTYSLSTRQGNSGSVMVDFISEGGRQGYCEQYAAAMAWLVRAAGIPARVAFGFTKGNNRNGNVYTLTNFNLHAWTEVYFDGFGWVAFDATPAAAVTGSVPSAWAPDPTAPQGPITAPDADDFAPGQAPSTSGSAAPAPQFGGNDTGATDGTGLNGGNRWPLYVLGGAVAALILLLLPALRRAALRRRRSPGAGTVDPPVAVGDGAAGAAGAVVDSLDPAVANGLRRARRDAHAAWDELIDTMVDYRVEIDPAETPRLTSERLITEARLTGAASSGVKVLSRAEERARYARSPITGADLATPLRDVRASLRDGVSWRTRMIATLLPPSVLARWRLGFSTGYARFVTTAGRRRDTLFRTISPRRLLSRGAAR
jgi:transglutaminase-like putative cysteine protease